MDTNGKIRFIDALCTVDLSDDNEAPIDIEAICEAANVSRWFIDSDKLGVGLKAYWVQSWMCTDTVVGVQALYLHSSLVGYTHQTGRRSDYNVYYLGIATASATTEFIRSCLIHAVEEEYSIAPAEKLDSMIDVYDSVMYAGQIMRRDMAGFVDGRDATYSPPRNGPSYLPSTEMNVVYDDTKETARIKCSQFKIRLHIR